MLLRAVDVLDIYVEPFIQSGFRLPNQPYSYYYRSLFSLHNETLSVWIHLLGTFILIQQIYQHIIYLSHESYSSVIYIYIIYNCIGACIMLLCSAQAHLLHSRTVADHIRSFYLDYFGINFYGITSGIVLRRFSHKQINMNIKIEKESISNDETYYLILGLLSLYSLSIACFCKTFYRRPYPFSHKFLQCSGVLTVYFYQIWPVLKNLFSNFIFYSNENDLFESEQKALYWHLIQFSSFILSGLIFVGRIPERFCPGSFDLFGQSHHAFHLTIFLMAYSQTNAVFEDMRSKTTNITDLNYFKDILYTIIILILQLLTVSLWFRISRPTIEQRYEVELKKQL
ncbi:unnamed protein product [Adineta steineri]|uniref:Uncharacterized protein n=1 Tax=Adineta steineri TaxID=433720 RepID=A0A813WD87_9BILA|nr:unnamed protein product [Adineta steineri]CAF3690728.1 unnamed protein product [Adineta steineri]